MNKPRDLDFLLRAAFWQDSLLQAYRAIHLTFQSILMAIGIGLTVAIASFEKIGPTLIIFVIFMFLFVLQEFVTKKMKALILNRGEDINFWHRTIIEAEQDLPTSERSFTDFKIYQQARRQNVEHLNKIFLSEKRIEPNQVDILIEKGLGHTRHVIDEQIFNSISWLWRLLLVCELIFLILRTGEFYHWF